MSSISHIIHAHVRDIGFPVRRLLPAAEVRTVGPFVFFDHMGPYTFSTEGSSGDVRPHPHIGLATVTYLFSGAMMHRDSLGSVQRIVPGDINWMTSGRGITHSERVPEDIRQQGVAVQGLQMWVALPQKNEETTPGFWHYPEADLPFVQLEGATYHVLVGTAFGQTSPVKTHSDTLYVSARLAAGTSMQVTPDYAERAIYIISGALTVDGQAVDQGALIVLKSGSTVTVVAPRDTAFMILGGEPLDGPRFLWWNFVASTKERIERAKLAWLNQEQNIFPSVPGETEFIPLPQS
ncbi:pirin family protein [Glaciimonas sp. Gout2]|uniref:pirin family protein n=1 Tax=unclassified Glaciimonas TaxID=2644401 RepID=UPI002B221C52|nr:MULTISPECIES: pirin family protein [unclassified Glaciimonas]MEB0010246.1 pirin family protein [Glaciimonas sp. Cout2]MEB0083745.1 pirin family protein [Glaciimonas sp. Gout2]